MSENLAYLMQFNQAILKTFPDYGNV